MAQTSFGDTQGTFSYMNSIHKRWRISQIFKNLYNLRFLRVTNFSPTFGFHFIQLNARIGAFWCLQKARDKTALLAFFWSDRSRAETIHWLAKKKIQNKKYSEMNRFSRFSSFVRQRICCLSLLYISVNWMSLLWTLGWTRDHDRLWACQRLMERING